jgi:16S rRNA (guanine1207-N2)-methyltransferase
MSHYYVNDDSVTSDEHILDLKVKDISMRLYTDRGVFSKGGLDFGTRVLLESMVIPPSAKTIIDMGSGDGPISIFLAKSYPDKHVYAFDVNERAFRLTKKNMQENGVSNAEAKVSFLFENVTVNADVVVTNPPIRAGKQTVFKLYEQAFENLNVGGILYVVIQKKQGAPSSFAKLEELFGSCEVIEKKAGYWILLAQKK